MRTEEFFAYANEREAIRRRRADGVSFPWTDDPILQSYKFTNVFRHFDRTSSELINRLYSKFFYEDARSILLNAALSRYFGRWEFAAAIGWQNFETYDKETIRQLAADRRAAKQPVFTGAYVITNGGIADDKENVVLDRYIDSLYDAIPELVKIAQMTRSWEQVAGSMRRVEGFGGSGFMVKETLLDTTYTNFWNEGRDPLECRMLGNDACAMTVPDDWWSWTPIGPGARRGIARLLGYDDLKSADAKPITNAEPFCLSKIMDLYADQRNHWKYFQKSPMAPTDIQFTLCEFDKYERVRLGQGRPRSTYKKPK